MTIRTEPRLFVQVDVSAARNASDFADVYECADRTDAEAHYERAQDTYPQRAVRIVARVVEETVIATAYPVVDQANTAG